MDSVSSSSPAPGPGPIGPPSFASRSNYSTADQSEQPLYTSTVGSVSFGQELLKLNPENQVMGFSHQLSYSQQSSPPTPATNSTVSMSRLNPRAPDFSVSYAKHQSQHVFHPQTNNPNMAALALATTLNKQYHRPASNGHARWSYGPVPQGYQHQGQEVVNVFTNHNVLPNAVDMLSNFENGTMISSPSISPSSSANNPTGTFCCYRLSIRLINQQIPFF